MVASARGRRVAREFGAVEPGVHSRRPGRLRRRCSASERAPKPRRRAERAVRRGCRRRPSRGGHGGRGAEVGEAVEPKGFDGMRRPVECGRPWRTVRRKHATEAITLRLYRLLKLREAGVRPSARSQVRRPVRPSVRPSFHPPDGAGTVRFRPDASPSPTTSPVRLHRAGLSVRTIAPPGGAFRRRDPSALAPSPRTRIDESAVVCGHAGGISPMRRPELGTTAGTRSGLPSPTALRKGRTLVVRHHAVGARARDSCRRMSAADPAEARHEFGDGERARSPGGPDA